MESILRLIFGRWLMSFVGFAAISMLVWYFAPFIPFMAPWYMRLGLIVFLLLLWVGVNWILDRRRRKKDSALVKGVTESAKADATAAASAEEVAAMSEKLTTALNLLKKASGSRGYLYEQPWYAIIGPPGAGKTTALLNAGLKFPLAAEMGQSAVAGVGGTRMCDWWFTEDAVLIDTAGRYTTQDSDSAVDKAGWDAFLALLKRTRTRQPLNGVIVAMAMTDIASASQADRMAHARAIRRRVKELSDNLGVKVPVYALFTKADLIAGFTEFFDDLDRERRGQVWGMTFPLSTGEAGTAGAFNTEYGLLVDSLNQRLIDRLQNERSADRRGMIAGFPAQVSSLKTPLAEFVQEAFGGSRLDPAPLLRGVYIASGTQEGTPIDRLTGAMARSFGIDQRRAPSLRPEQGRSYFLTRLLKEVVFGEATLVSRDPGKARRSLIWRIAAASVAALLVIGCTAALIQTRSANNTAVLESETALAAYIAAAQTLKLDPVAESDLTTVLPVLDKARALPFGPDAPPPPTQWFPGLSQIDKLATGAQRVYLHALDNILLPRLIHRLEAQMKQNFNNPAFLYEATRIYLMLGSAGSLDRASVKEWMHYDWEAAYPGAPAQTLRKHLETHLAALLDEPLPTVTLDGTLVEDARRTFSRVSLAERVYASIRRSPEATALPQWSPADAAGASGIRVFVRKSGQQLSVGIPGFFTIDGFHKVLLPQLPIATLQVTNDSWVLGKTQQVDPISLAAVNLQKDVVALYTTDYAKQWDALMADIDVMPLTNLQDGVQTLYILSSPQSPMRDLLASIVRQLTLSVPPPPPAGTNPAAVAAAAAAAAASGGAARLQGLLGPSGPPPEPPGKVIDDRYAPLITFVGKGPGAPVDNVLKILNDLQAQLAHVANTVPGGPAAPASGVDPAQMLQAEASRDPEPVQRWLKGLAVAGNAQRSGGAKKAANEAFNAPGGPASLCKLAVDGRYPFTPGAANEIPLDDFARLFAPNGMLDVFYTTQLRPFVDTSGTVWKAQPAAGVAPPVTPGDLSQFQRASQIRDLFFAGGAAQPTVRFDITPQTLDAGAKQVIMDLDGLTISYAHGPLRATSVTWPGGAQRINNARLVFDPPPSSGPPVVQASGPWALFRLFGMGKLVQGASSDRYTLTFQLADREAAFEIRAGSVLNPFAPGMLGNFRCPNL
jgi:type VI secretion system protein ImpL